MALNSRLATLDFQFPKIDLQFTNHSFLQKNDYFLLKIIPENVDVTFRQTSMSSAADRRQPEGAFELDSNWSRIVVTLRNTEIDLSTLETLKIFGEEAEQP
jgi:hypothetical protein